MKNIDNRDQPLPLMVILAMPVYVCAITSLFLFPISGDWSWLEGWAFVISFSINLGIAYYLINRINPRVLRNRMKVKKEGLTDKIRKPAQSDLFILPFVSLGFFGALIIPALDYRFGWSAIPLAAEIIGLVLANLGTLIMNTALRQNAFASKILDISKGQRLIDTGLYAHVRHPLYAGGILMIMAVPIVLGSWWGLIPATVGSLTLAVRIEFEEAMLEEGMEGYRDYQSRVRHKLIPGIY